MRKWFWPLRCCRRRSASSLCRLWRRRARGCARACSRSGRRRLVTRPSRYTHTLSLSSLSLTHTHTQDLVNNMLLMEAVIDEVKDVLESVDDDDLEQMAFFGLTFAKYAATTARTAVDKAVDMVFDDDDLVHVDTASRFEELDPEQDTDTPLTQTQTEQESDRKRGGVRERRCTAPAPASKAAAAAAAAEQHAEGTSGGGGGRVHVQTRTSSLRSAPPENVGRGGRQSRRGASRKCGKARSSEKSVYSNSIAWK